MAEESLFEQFIKEDAGVAEQQPKQKTPETEDKKPDDLFSQFIREDAGVVEEPSTAPVTEPTKAAPITKGNQLLAVELEPGEHETLDEIVEINRRKPLTAEELSKLLQNKTPEERRQILEKYSRGKAEDLKTPDIMGEAGEALLTGVKNIARKIAPSYIKPQTEEEKKKPLFETTGEWLQEMLPSSIVGEPDKRISRSRPIEEWYDYNTKQIKTENIRDFLNYEHARLPKEKKEKVANNILSTISGVDPKYILQARLLGDASGPIAETLQAMDEAIGLDLGKHVSYNLNKFISDRQPPMPKDFFSEQEKQYIRDNLHNGGSVQTNLVIMEIPEDVKTVEEAMQKMWKGYVGGIRDLYYEVGRNKLARNEGFSFMFANPTGVGAVANPISAIAAKHGVGFTGRLLAAATEGAIGGAAPSEEKGYSGENILTGMLLGTATDVTGSGVRYLGGKIMSPKERAKTGVGSSKAPDEIRPPKTRSEVRAETQRQILENEPVVDVENLSKIHRGEVTPVDIPPESLPALRESAGDLAKASVVKHVIEESAGKGAPITPETMEVVFNQGVRDKRIQDRLDYMITLTEGISPEQKIQDVAFRKVASQMDAGAKSIAEELMKSTDYKLALGDPEKMQALMKSKKLEGAYTPFEYELNKTSRVEMYRGYLIEAARALVDDMSDVKMDKFNISALGSRTIKNLVTMVTEAPDLTKSVNDFRSLVGDLEGKVHQITETFSRLEKIEDPRIASLKKHINDAFIENVPVDRAYFIKELQSIGKDYGEIGSTKTMAAQLSAYNNILRKMGEVKQEFQNVVAQTAFVNSAVEASNKRNAVHENLVKSIGVNNAVMRPSTVAARFNEHINQAMLNERLPADVKAATDNFIKEASINIAAGGEVPKASIDNFKMAIEKAKGIQGINSIRDLIAAVEFWNKEVNHIETLRETLGQSFESPSDLTKLVPALQQASKDIISPINLQRLETFHAYLSRIWQDTLEGSGLSNTTRTQLYEYLFGDTLTKMKQEANPNTPINTEAHAKNVLDALSINTKEILDELDEIHKEVLGTPLNREWYLARVATPMNGHNINKALQNVLLNIKEFQKHAEVARKEKSSSEPGLSVQVLNSEMLAYEIVRKSHLSIGNDVMELQGREKLAATRWTKEFGKTVDYISGKMQGVWGLNGFSEVVSKLTGSRGLPGLYDFMFMQSRDGKATLTKLGRMVKDIFTNEQEFAIIQKAYEVMDKTGDSSVLEKYIRSKMGVFDEGSDRLLGEGKPALQILQEQNFVAHFIQYFSDPVLREKQVTAGMWREAFEYVGFSTKERARAWDIHDEVIAEGNKYYEGRDIFLTPREWREDYIPTKKNNNSSLTDTFDGLFLTEDLSRRFGSSRKTQLDKANKIASHEAMHPARALVLDLQAMVRESYTAHTKTSLQRSGILLQNLGFLAEAKALDMAIQRQVGKFVEDLKAMSDQKLSFYALPNAVAPFVATIAKTMGYYVPMVALNRINSLINNTLQQTLNQAAYTKGGTRSIPVQLVNTLGAAIGSIFKNEVLPTLTIITPESHKAVFRVAEMLRDNTRRAELNFINRMSIEVNKPKAGIFGTPKGALGGIAKIGRKMESFVDKSMEVVIENLKERTELSNSKATLTRAAKVYEDAIKVYKKEGFTAMYHFMRDQFGMQTTASVFNIASEMARYLEAGKEPFGDIQDVFLLMYHNNAAGRFGSRNAPLGVTTSGIGVVAPAATRFLSARTNNLFRYGWLAPRELQISVGNMFKEHKVPPQIGSRIYTATLYAAGLGLSTYLLYEGLDGLIGTSSDERNKEERFGAIRKMMRQGTGYDITNLAPIDVELIKKVLDQLRKGDGLGAIGSLGEAFIDTSRQRGVPFGGPELYEMWKGFQVLNENTGDKIPLLSYFESRLDAKQKELEKYRAELPTLMKKNPEKVFELLKRENEIENEIVKLKDKYSESIMRGVTDHFLNSFPPTAWITWGFHPFTVATTYRDAAARQIFNQDKYEVLTAKGAVPPLAVIQQAIGLTVPGDNSIVAAREFYKAWYAPLVEYGICSKEQADLAIKQAYKIDAWLQDTDADLHLLMQTEHIPGKKMFEEIKKRVYPKSDVVAPERPLPESSPEVRKMRQKSLLPDVIKPGGK